jgi:fumarate reductase flavoprotein subunit
LHGERAEVSSSNDVDFIVAGAGGGLVGALRAAELGASVLVVEASEHYLRGNNTSMSTAMFPGAGSRWQHEQGLVDSPEIFAADIMRKTKGTADQTLTSSLTEVSARLVEWMADSQGVPLELVTDFHYPGHSVDRCHTIPGRKGDRVLSHLTARINAHDSIDLMFPARLTGVELQPDHSLLAHITMPGGSIEHISARKILMATNGFGADRDMVSTYIPEISEALYHGSETSRGDSIRIGRSLGAATGFLDAYQGHAAIAVHGSTLAGWATVMHGAVMVNIHGERFGDETCGYSEYAAILAKQPEAIGWLILDQRIHDLCMSFRDFQETVESGALREAPTLEALAEVTSLPADRLIKTIQDSKLAAQGIEKDTFGRTGFEAPLASPFIAIKVRPALFHTQGGVITDSSSNVLGAEGFVIPGLYAAGGAAAGISGHGAAGYLAGNGLLSAFGMSFLAAESFGS